MVLKDARELLFTEEVNEREVIDQKKSQKACNTFFENNDSAIVLIPGFIATRLQEAI